jgi:hypothetical protein
MTGFSDEQFQPPAYIRQDYHNPDHISDGTGALRCLEAGGPMVTYPSITSNACGSM